MEGSLERHRIKEIEQADLKQTKGIKRADGSKDIKRVRFGDTMVKESDKKEEDNDKAEDKHNKDNGKEGNEDDDKPID